MAESNIASIHSEATVEEKETSKCVCKAIFTLMWYPLTFKKFTGVSGKELHSQPVLADITARGNVHAQNCLFQANNKSWEVET